MFYGFFRVAFRKEIDLTLDGLQATLDSCPDKLTKRGSQHEKWCHGKIPLQTSLSTPLRQGHMKLPKNKR